MAEFPRIQSLKNPDCWYDVVAYDAATSTATISGRGATFTISPFTKERLAQDGYELVKPEVQNAQS